VTGAGAEVATTGGTTVRAGATIADAVSMATLRLSRESAYSTTPAANVEPIETNTQTSVLLKMPMMSVTTPISTKTMDTRSNN
jgi:hypothetical protein